MLSIKIISLNLLISALCFSQSVNIGIKLESLGYSYTKISQNTSEYFILPLPLSGYLKSSIFYSKYEFEVKVGIQLEENFAGFEYALSAKYNLLGSMFPLLVYLNHNNAGGDHGISGGSYNHSIKFIGFGIEAKLHKVFGMDLIYYLPIGIRDLEYSNNIYSSLTKTTASKMNSMIKLGFIFNINL